MKTVSLFLALINSLMAGLILVFSLSSTELGQAEAWWSLTRVAAALCVILIGLLTWLAGTRTINAAAMALCSLMVVALGAATIVWTFHLSLVSGDMEFYMFVYGGSLIAQGMASLLGFAGDPRSVSSL